MAGNPGRILARLCAVLLAALILQACRPGPDRPAEEPPSPPPWPLFDYAAAATGGARLVRLVADRSSIDVVVRRDGPLARFGHDHVLTVAGAEGYLLLGAVPAAYRADLRFPVESLEVDGAEARQRYALTTEPDADDIRGTRDNLLQHVLDSWRWPWVRLAMTDFSGSDEEYSALVTIDVNGAQYAGRHRFRLSRSGSGVSVSGSLTLRQTELGLEPFSVLGGGLLVADPMEIHFRLEGMLQ